MKKITLLTCGLILFSLISYSQPFFQLDSIRHPNCMSTTGHAYFTLFYPVPGSILVKGALIPGMEYQTFDALAVVDDINGNGIESYTFSQPMEGDIRLYFVYPALTRIDSINFHFNSHLLNVSGGFSGVASCDSISPSGMAFSEGTPPYNLYMTEDNWQNTTFIGNYTSSNPSVQTNVSIPLPVGHYQFKLADKYCVQLYPEPSADFSVWGIGHFDAGKWVCVCPELNGDTMILDQTNIYNRSLTAISAGIYTKWDDTLMITANYGDGSPADTFYQTVEQWQLPLNISHIYTNIGIFEVQYEIRNTRVALISTSYIFNTHEHVQVVIVSVPEVTQNANEITLFPNPVNNTLNVSLYNERIETLRLKIYNETGQLVYEKETNINKGRNALNIPVDFLNNGIYTLQFVTNNELKSRKFIK
jgi:hypothetical protein